MLVTRVERLECVAPGSGGVRALAFDVEASVAAPVDPAPGMVVNLVDVKAALRGPAICVYDLFITRPTEHRKNILVNRRTFCDRFSATCTRGPGQARGH